MFKKNILSINCFLLFTFFLVPVLLLGNNETSNFKKKTINPPPPSSCVGDALRVEWFQFHNFGGTDFEDLIHLPNFPQNPDWVQNLPNLETPMSYGDNFGSLIRGFIKAPDTGNYTFQIDGDNKARFYLSTDTNPEDLVLQCEILTTGNDESVNISLEMDSLYYFEILSIAGDSSHNNGIDFVRINWKGPNDNTYQLVESAYLYRNACGAACNDPGTPCDDGDATTSNDKEDGYCNCVGIPNNPPFNCIGGQSDIQVLYYDNISGNMIMDLTSDPSYPLSPTRVTSVEHLSIPYTNETSNYGARIRGFLRVPVTGEYDFNITAHARAAFYLSDQEIPNTETDEVCSVGFSAPFDFDNDPTQDATPVVLQAGQFYSFEVLHKEWGNGPEFVNVFWKTPFQAEGTWQIIPKGVLYGYACEMATFPVGTPCDDGNANTFNDQYDSMGNCTGIACADDDCTNSPDYYYDYDNCGSTGGHSSIEEESWKSCQATQSPNPSRGTGHWIRYDLGQTYTLNHAQVWNYNVTGQTGQGFNNVVIDYSLDGSNWSELGTYNWAEATGTIDYGGFLFNDLNGVVARYILITAIDNFDGSNCFGLSEVAFSAIACAPLGTPCNDGNASTTNDQYDNNCNCIGEENGELVNNCIEPHYNLSGNIPADQYHATLTITSDGVVQQNTTVYFIAGESITLLPGFQTELGSQFYAAVIECTIDYPPCVGNAQNVEWLQFRNLEGIDFEYLIHRATFPQNPDEVQNLSSLETSTNYSDDFGSLIRGFIKAPETGDYNFRLSTADKARFYLSTNTERDNLQLLCEQLTSGSEIANTITLEADNFYYFEILGVGEGGNDNFIKMEYQRPSNSSNWELIQGTDLHQYTCATICADGGTPCDDGDPTTSNDQEDGCCNCFGTPDNLPFDCIGTAGDIQALYYDDIPGHLISDLLNHPTFPQNPTRVAPIGHLSIPYTNEASNYGARIRGFLRAPVTGTYDFNITAHARAAFYLSDQETPDINTDEVCSVGFSTPFDFDNDPTQDATPIVLQAGQFYSFEVLHKEWGNGPEFVNVFWKTPLHGEDNWQIIPNGVLYGYACEMATLPIATPSDGTTAYNIENGGLLQSHMQTGRYFYNADLTDTKNHEDKNKEFSKNEEQSRLLFSSEKPTLKIFPNLTQTWTNFHFNLPKDTNIKLGVYTANGQLLTWVVNGTYLEKGRYEKRFPAQLLTGGVYYVSLFANGEIISERFIVIE